MSEPRQTTTQTGPQARSQPDAVIAPQAGLRRLWLPDADATAALAQRLAPLCRAGDQILLSGPIGAGKTHFARSLIQALLGHPEDVPSPSFTLVQSYAAADFDIWHADLYRLTHPDEVEELGLFEAFDHALCLIEWPDRLGSLAPGAALSLQFADQAEGRALTLASTAPRWQGVIDTISSPQDADDR